MVIIQNYLTNNPYYIAGRTIKPAGLMLHSVGVPQPDPLVFVKNWNKSTYNAACVHAFIGENDTHITLPIFETPGIAWRAPHAGSGPNGSANNTHIGIEMCEPDCIKYIGGATFTCSNYPKARAFVEKTTQNAATLFAKLCKFHNLDPLKKGVIISHIEGHSYGIASGHADPEHLWTQLEMDYNMDKFRQDVYYEMNNIKEDDNFGLRCAKNFKIMKLAIGVKKLVIGQ